MNMGAYHAMLVHFPLALWTTAALVILIRALSDGPFARACDRVLTPLLLLGVLTGALAFGVGFLVRPIEAITESPMGRNHLLLASWTLAYWTLVLVTRWRLGERAWFGASRWIMLGIAALGAGLLTITGNLGGLLTVTGNATAVTALLRSLGWEVYTTFYVPDVVLVLIVAAAGAMVVVALVGRKRTTG
jgi:uncharacterized membrane protein